MLRGRGTTSSVIQAAGSPGSGVSARPNALVVLVNTKLPTPAATASSSSVSVPLTVVSTNACLPCEPTWGLCSVAVCRTASTPARLWRTTARSVTDPTTVVCGDGRTSSPVTSCPPSRSTRTRASPRWPELPVTRTFATATPASVLTAVSSGQRVYLRWPAPSERGAVGAASVVVGLPDQLGDVVLLAEQGEQPLLGLQVVDVLFLVAENCLEDIRAGHIAHAAHVLDAAPEPVHRLHLHRQIRLEHLADGLADAEREQALEVRQPVEKQDPVRQRLGVPHLVD